ncbi:hypothetical protein WL46_15330 [Burkholderia ubonensis]|nr:hypothetical protein WL46_15330 [Burkholderia ubonensis]
MAPVENVECPALLSDHCGQRVCAGRGIAVAFPFAGKLGEQAFAQRLEHLQALFRRGELRGETGALVAPSVALVCGFLQQLSRQAFVATMERCNSLGMDVFRIGQRVSGEFELIAPVDRLALRHGQAVACILGCGAERSQFGLAFTESVVEVVQFGSLQLDPELCLVLGRACIVGGLGSVTLQMHDIIQLDGDCALPERAHLFGDRRWDTGNGNLGQAGFHKLTFDRIQVSRQRRWVASAKSRAQLTDRYDLAKACATGRGGIARLGEHGEHSRADRIGGDSSGARHGHSPTPGDRSSRERSSSVVDAAPDR